MLLPLILTASLLSNVASAISASDISSDLPISSLLSSADSHLAKGETNDALVYYDVAISRDPSNYLSVFKRGATYLSLGRTSQALSDFDKVLSIRPGFEGALLQRARLRSKIGDWDGAKQDYVATTSGTEELIALEEAQEAATLAFEAEKAGKWEDCINHAGTAILVANKVTSLRQMRAHCRFERGEMEEGVSDLMHVLQLQPGNTDPHVQISTILFYALRDTEKGMNQIRKCLHSDPDSKSCKKLHRREKQIDKELNKVNKYFEKKQYSSAVKLLVPHGEDAGLIQEIKDDVKEFREAGTIPANAPNDLVARVVEMACEAYHETKSKKAVQWCDEALSLYEHSLPGLLSKAQRQMDAEDFDACIATLNLAKEHHPSASQIDGLLRSAQIALKRSKEKDYYKVLGVANDADERQIKSAFRKMTKMYHPDKAKSNGMTKEEAQKKMAEVNEAYEVLSDPELRARFDRGDDPNSNEPQHGSPFGGGGQHFAFRQGGQQFKFQGGGSGGGSGFPGGFQFNF